MAMKSCSTSDWERALSALLRCAKKQKRIAFSDEDLLTRKLGPDLLEEILIRLPDHRSACRCKLVCRLFRSVVSTASFNRRFVSHRQIMTTDDLKSMVLTFLPPTAPNHRDALQVLDCDEGLVLCGFCESEYENGALGRSYLLCNPFTKQWIAVPLAPRKSRSYTDPVTRLFCEPPQTSRNRFRVVCMYQAVRSGIRLDVFCSESGEWTKDALVRNGHSRPVTKTVVSCKGELFWIYKKYPDVDTLFVDAFNPFRLDTPPTSIDVSEFVGKPGWFLAVSQDALHAIEPERETVLSPVPLSSVWKWEETSRSWRKQCEGKVIRTSKCGNYEFSWFHKPFLHPGKPEIVFFFGAGGGRSGEDKKSVILCGDLRKQEVELFAEPKGSLRHFLVFQQPRGVSCWATPIPNFDKLRAMMYKSSSDPFTRYREVASHGVRRIRKKKTSKVREVARQHE